MSPTPTVCSSTLRTRSPASGSSTTWSRFHSACSGLSAAARALDRRAPVAEVGGQRAEADDGEACADLSPVTGERARVVYYTHAALYLVYVGGMLSITYFSFLKSCLKAKKLPPIFVIVAAALFFCVPQAILYITL